MKRTSRILWTVAVSLVVIYGSVSTLVHLFHNHHDLVQRDDCPACLWQQMSQDSHPDDGLANQIETPLMVVALLQTPLQDRVATERDFSPGIQPRAPPA